MSIHLIGFIRITACLVFIYLAMVLIYLCSIHVYSHFNKRKAKLLKEEAIKELLLWGLIFLAFEILYVIISLFLILFK